MSKRERGGSTGNILRFGDETIIDEMHWRYSYLIDQLATTTVSLDLPAIFYFFGPWEILALQLRGSPLNSNLHPTFIRSSQSLKTLAAMGHTAAAISIASFP
ncbi:Uncharacterized protein Fot_26503 [Forsythia ovata]|uniref:Uncharacterized protein n=1 Tax=Forsythia ovata TaxID=205694 RepID=A0ABD1UC65_9LAMI